MKGSKNIVKTIRTKHEFGIYSLCLLKDKRLVSCGRDSLITVYSESYKIQFHIRYAHDMRVNTICVLRSGELLSGGGDNDIKVWRIGEDDYELIHILKGHTQSVWKIIQLKNDKICSCSEDRTIKIWDNYQCIQTLQGHTDDVKSIIEMNNLIISASFDKTLRIWDQSTYQPISIIIKAGECYTNHLLTKLNDDTLVLGGWNAIKRFNIRTCKVHIFKKKSFGEIWCLYVNRSGLVLIGTDFGEIYFYNPSSNQITFKKRFYNDSVSCIIETENDQLISSSIDDIIKVCD